MRMGLRGVRSRPESSSSRNDDEGSKGCGGFGGGTESVAKGSLSLYVARGFEDDAKRGGWEDGRMSRLGMPSSGESGFGTVGGKEDLNATRFSSLNY